MADVDTENVYGIVDKRRNNKGQNTSQLLTTAANYDDVASLKARLGAISATTYSAARLNSMTKNDMVFALRHTDDAAGL